MMRSLSFVLLGLSVTLPVFSEHILPVRDNSKVSANIAPFDVNRIFVEGDRIKSVKGVEGNYMLQQDTQAGQIFIKPLIPQHPFTIFITTENNKNYQLQLIPSAKSSETLLLKPSGNSILPLTASVLSLMRAMVENKNIDDYQVRLFHLKHPTLLSPNIEITLVKRVENDLLQGEIYALENKSTSPLIFTESQFYRPGTLAVTLDTLTVPAQGTTTLYLVNHAQH